MILAFQIAHYGIQDGLFFVDTVSINSTKYEKLRVSVGMVITILYIVIGTIFDLWHPGWIMFLLFLSEILLTLLKEQKVRWSYINVNKESNKYEDSEESNE